MDPLVQLLVSIIVWGIIFYVCWWGLGKIGLAEPFNKIAVAVLVLLTVLVVIDLAFGTPFGGATRFNLRLK